MSGLDNSKKVYLMDSGAGVFDWSVHAEDIEDFAVEYLSWSTFVDIHLACIILGLSIEEMKEKLDDECRPANFPLPVVRRGQQIRWKLRELLQYRDKRVAVSMNHHWLMEFERNVSCQRNPSEGE